MTSRTTEVCHTEYVILDSGVTKGPLYSAQDLTAAQVAGSETISRTGSFHQETGIPDADRSQDSDYTNSGYDRGTYRDPFCDRFCRIADAVQVRHDPARGIRILIVLSVPRHFADTVGVIGYGAE